MERVPTAKRIEKVLGVSAECARRVRGLMDGTIRPETSPAVQAWVRTCYNRPPPDEELALEAIKEALGAFDVGVVRGEDWDPYYGDCLAAFCNMGDTYAPTIIRCHVNETWLLLSYGDYVEKYLDISM